MKNRPIRQEAMLPAWDKFLRGLARLGGVGTVQEVAAVIGKGAGALGSRVNSMEKRGYLTRGIDGILRLTAKAQAPIKADVALATPLVTAALTTKELRILRRARGSRVAQQQVVAMLAQVKNRIDEAIEKADRQPRHRGSQGWITEGSTPSTPREVHRRRG